MIEAILVWSWQHQIVLWSMCKANFIMKKSTLITYCFSNHMLPSAFLKLDKIQATLQTFAPLLCLASSSCFALKVFLQSQQSFTNFQPAPLLYFFHVTFCLNNLARMILRKKGSDVISLLANLLWPWWPELNPILAGFHVLAFSAKNVIWRFGIWSPLLDS